MEKNPCKEGKIKNPKNNRCVSITGNIGKKVLERQQPCPEGKIRNQRGRCVKYDSKKQNIANDFDYIPDQNYIPSDNMNSDVIRKIKYYKKNGKKAQEILLNYRKSIGKIDGFEDYEKADYTYAGRLVFLPPIRKMTKQEKKKEKAAERRYQERMRQQSIIDEENENVRINRLRGRPATESEIRRRQEEHRQAVEREIILERLEPGNVIRRVGEARQIQTQRMKRQERQQAQMRRQQ